MANARTPLRDLELKLARIDGGAVGPRQRAQVEAKGLARPQLDVEILGKLAERTVRQDIVPPWIVLRGGHVVRYDIQQDSQPMRARAADEIEPSGLAAEVFADSRRVRHIVAMLTAGNRLQAGREVHVADSQIGQIGQHALRLPQWESGMQLQAVARDPITAHDSARRTTAPPG